MTRKTYDPEIKAQALVLYSAGMSYRAIAKVLKISNHKTVSRWIDPKIVQYEAKYRKQNCDRIRQRKTRYRKQNRNSICKYSSEYYRKNSGRICQQQAEYYQQKREQIRQRSTRYNKENPEKARARKAKRRASKRNATPPWYTKEHQRQVEALQAEAVRLQRETGIQHHVDHIYPLTGKTRLNGKYQHTSCGLHVPWNLKVLPGPENCKKTYKLPDPATDPPTAW